MQSLSQRQKQKDLDYSLAQGVVDPSCTIDRIKHLLASGANPERLYPLYDSNGVPELTDLHTCGLNALGQSPNSLQNPYEGSKEVMEYLFAVLLERKLQSAIDKEKKMYAALPHDPSGVSFVSRHWDGN